MTPAASGPHFSADLVDNSPGKTTKGDFEKGSRWKGRGTCSKTTPSGSPDPCETLPGRSLQPTPCPTQGGPAEGRWAQVGALPAPGSTWPPPTCRLSPSVHTGRSRFSPAQFFLSRANTFLSSKSRYIYPQVAPSWQRTHSPVCTTPSPGRSRALLGYVTPWLLPRHEGGKGLLHIPSESRAGSVGKQLAYSV